MTKLLASHAPHIAFVLAGVVAFFWTAYRKPANGRRLPEAPAVAAPARVRPVAPVRVARRALLALGPLLAALATAAALYGMDVGGAPVPGALIWGHVGVSVLALVLVGYKLASMRGKRIIRGLASRRLTELLSLVLGALSVPLLISGIDLLVAPSDGSFAAYSHLVASAWWTVLLLWHLRRYVGASLRALSERPVHAPGEAPARAPAPAPAAAAPAAASASASASARVALPQE